MAEKRVQRRLAAILAADVVGYSRMMRENEAGTLAQLKTHRIEVFDPHIDEHNGRIVKTTGDGVLVEFASAVRFNEHSPAAMRTFLKAIGSSCGSGSISATLSWTGTTSTVTA